MSFLAFDIGTKRIGVAHSDEENQFAFPDPVLLNNSQLFDEIFQLLEKYQPKGIVVGYSDSGTRTKNPIQKYIEKFTKELEARFGLPIYDMNEAVTTVEVRRLNNYLLGQRVDTAKKRAVAINDVVDSESACFILQRFLEVYNADDSPR